MDCRTPKIMGILNITPDSFYSGSRLNQEDVLAAAELMAKDGADILDVGGQSTRPGANMISETEELKRVIPVIELIHRALPDIIISVDSFRASVIKEAAAITPCIVNDISGFAFDDNLLDVVADLNLPYILMHMKGTPKDMKEKAEYDDVVFEVLDYFGKKLSIIRQHNIHQIIIDPGIGFAKNISQNFTLLKNLKSLTLFEYPVIVGLSRKSLIYKTLNTEPHEALNGTTALHMFALMNGASILRVHDVKAASEVRKLIVRMHKTVND